MTAFRLVAFCAVTVLAFSGSASEVRAESMEALCARTEAVTISPACLQALDLVHDEFPSEDVIEHINDACREEVQDSVMYEKFKELSPDGTIALCPLNSKTLFVDADEEGMPSVIDATPGRFAGTGE
jgi:hypothetical protein